MRETQGGPVDAPFERVEHVGCGPCLPRHKIKIFKKRAQTHTSEQQQRTHGEADRAHATHTQHTPAQQHHIALLYFTLQVEITHDLTTKCGCRTTSTPYRHWQRRGVLGGGWRMGGKGMALPSLASVVAVDRVVMHVRHRAHSS